MIGLKIGPEYKKFNGKWYKKDTSYSSRTLAKARTSKLKKEGFRTRITMAKGKKLWFIIWKKRTPISKRRK